MSGGGKWSDPPTTARTGIWALLTGAAGAVEAEAAVAADGRGRWPLMSVAADGRRRSFSSFFLSSTLIYTVSPGPLSNIINPRNL